MHNRQNINSLKSYNNRPSLQLLLNIHFITNFSENNLLLKITRIHHNLNECLSLAKKFKNWLQQTTRAFWYSNLDRLIMHSVDYLNCYSIVVYCINILHTDYLIKIYCNQNFKLNKQQHTIRFTKALTTLEFSLISLCSS